jgi:hypothetical protein|tara:strand:+ start:620 stop:826 length:207 start_codon:yes stop_codon:yes gene_type:complete
MDEVLKTLMDSGSPEMAVPAGTNRVLIFKDDPEDKAQVYCLLQLTDTGKIMIIGHMKKADMKRVGRSL